VSEYFFEHKRIDISVLIHQCCGSVAELMGGKATVVEVAVTQGIVNDLFDASVAYS